MPSALKSERLTVRLDPERAARLEYAVRDSGGRFTTYNQLMVAAIDEWLDRHTYSAGSAELTVKLPARGGMDLLHEMREDGFGDFDFLVANAIAGYSNTIYEAEKEHDELRSEANLRRQSRRRGLDSLSTGGI